MIVPQIVGFIMIVLMIGIVYLATKYVSSARYRGHGIYHITINAWLRGNKGYRNWLRDNKDYHWCILLVLSLCPMILLLIEPFRQNKMFLRPEEALYVNIVLWTSIFFTYKWLFKKLSKHDNITERH